MESRDRTSLRALVAVVVFNEGEKLRRTLQTVPEKRSFDLLIVNDASTDGTEHTLAEFPYPFITHQANIGVGGAIKTAIRYATDHDYDILVTAAGNGKMQLNETETLLAPIREHGADYVQGSRYLKGGRSDNLPLFRRLMIPVFTWIVWLLTGYKGTDATCGFRAYRLDLINLDGVNIWQDWLDKYELEYYLHYHAIKQGLKLTEVPVSMIYPKSMQNYSKIRAVTGWWSMLRPWVYLKLGLRK
jgi:dolichol-phosphate mannosyltransferase